MSRRAVLYAALFLAGAGLRAIDLWHPVDGTVRESWRECDYASIARNYYREDPRFLYPRIDWRGDGPGFAEMELPATPWLIAQLYRVAGGVREEAGRLLVYGFALGSLAVFFALAARLLPLAGAVAASVFFAASPLAVRISNTLQPEGLMFLAYILAVYGFVRWLDSDRWGDFALAAVATAVAVLAKAGSALLGLLFVHLLWRRGGWAAFRRIRVWALGVLSLAPAVLWYAHARGFWHQYGNSLGLSNEYHWIGWDFFTNPYFIRGILTTDVFYVWMPAGVLVAAIGAVWRFGDRATQVALAWLGAVLLFYAAASRTTGDEWAIYYHVISVPPVALLFGAGVAAIPSVDWRPSRGLMMGAAVAAVFAMAALRALHVDLGYGAGVKLELLVALATVAYVVVLIRARPAAPQPAGGAAESWPARAVVVSAWCLAPLTLLLQLNRVALEAHPIHMQSAYACARQFAPLIPAGALVVESGAPCTDSDGYPVAYNEPYMFYWLDRKGFNVCNQRQSVAAVDSLRLRGAAFYLAKRTSMRMKPGYEHALRSRYQAVAECSEFVLFRLGPPAAERP